MPARRVFVTTIFIINGKREGRNHVVAIQQRVSSTLIITRLYCTVKLNQVAPICKSAGGSNSIVITGLGGVLLHALVNPGVYAR